MKNVEICFYCDHFIEQNDVHDPDPQIKYAAYLHLDNGEKEHDHDATQSGIEQSLDDWKKYRPDLFQEHTDGNIGPNSKQHIKVHGGILARKGKQ